MNILGNGTVVDIRHLCGEIERLHDGRRLYLPGKPYDKLPCHHCYALSCCIDGLEEARLSDKPYGSTKRGIAPVYGDKYMKKGIMLGELFDCRNTFVSHLSDVLEFKNLQITRAYGGEPFSLLKAWLNTSIPTARFSALYIGDTSAYLRKAAHEGKKDPLRSSARRSARH